MHGLLLMLATAAVIAAPPADCTDIEGLLSSATVVSQTEIGEGITGAMKVELTQGNCRLLAIFKTVNMRSPADFHFGLETTAKFGDSYRYEIAAYELDKLLDLGLVPPVVERTIDGHTGSLQMWVSGKWHRFAHGQAPPERNQAEDQVHVVRLLDYLIFNTDRHIRNFYFVEDWQPMVIDHSIAFHTMITPSRPLYRFPKQALERLETLNRRQLKKALHHYLEKDQIKSLDQRRKIMIDLAAEAIKTNGEAAVLFDWTGPQNTH